MEYLSSNNDLSITSAVAFSIVLAAFFAYQWSDQKRIERALQKQGIPSVYKYSLPYFGHIAQFFDPGRLELETFDQPDKPRLEYLTLFGNPLLVVHDPELCHAFWNNCRHWDKSAFYYSIMDVLLGSPEKNLVTHTKVSHKPWQAKRELAASSFKKDNLARLAAYIDQRVVALCDDWVQRGTNIHVDYDLTTLTLRVILYFVFGVNVTKQQVRPLQEPLIYMVEFAWSFNTSPLNAMKAFLPGTKAYRTVQNYRSFVKDLIAQTRAASPSDNTNTHLIHTLLMQKDWSEEVLENEVMTLIFAGHDTTAHATTIALENCLQHPTVIQSIREEYQSLSSSSASSSSTTTKSVYSQMKWPTAAFKESLRLNPETPGGTIRRAPKDFPLAKDAIVPEGCSVLCPMWGYNRSRANWGDNARDFHPERFLAGTTQEAGGGHRNFVSFSQGKRNCVGMPLAQMEGSLLLGYILTHLDLSIEVPLKKRLAVTLRAEELRVGVKLHEFL